MNVGLVTNDGEAFFRQRRPFLDALAARGDEVVVIGPGAHAAADASSGPARGRDWHLGRRSLDPWREWRALRALIRLERDERLDLTHHFTIKPNIYGVLAARRASVRATVCTVTGLGYAFTGKNPKALALRGALAPLYRSTLSRADRVIFQNPTDRITLGFEGGYVHIPGSGVDIEHFDPRRVDPAGRAAIREKIAPSASQIVLMVARPLRHKGFAEFLAAARSIRSVRPEAAFVLVGGADPLNPAGLPAVAVRDACDAAGVTWLGERVDVFDLLGASDVFVLPSYREGMPRALMEAMSMERAVVATDVPGCQDVVTDGETGQLVPARDTIALATAIERALGDPAMRERHGRAARAKVVASFSQTRVLAQTLALYAELQREKGIP